MPSESPSAVSRRRSKVSTNRGSPLIDLAVPKSVLDAGTACATDKEEVDAASEEQTVATAEVNTLEQRAQAIIGDRARRVEGPSRGHGCQPLHPDRSSERSRNETGTRANTPLSPSGLPKSAPAMGTEAQTDR